MLIGKCKRREGTAFGIVTEANECILKTGRRSNTHATLLPIVAGCDKDIEVAAHCVSACAVPSSAVRRVSYTIQAPDHRSVQVEATTERGGVQSELPAIYCDAAIVDEIRVGVGIASCQADREV